MTPVAPSPAQTAALPGRVLGAIRWPGRRALLVLACVVVALGAAYVLWLRDSSLVAVERTTVTGLTTAEAGRIESSLAEAARSMTTLNVDRERLERAVSGYPVVRDLRVDRHLPRGLTVEVIERRPLGVVPGPGGDPVAVAEDGVVLPGVEVRALPELPADQPVTGARVGDASTLTALEVLKAAPEPLAERARAVGRDPEAGGLVVALRGGLEVRLGAGSDLTRKWAAAAAVLATGPGAGGGYLDVSLPGRPAVGG